MRGIDTTIVEDPDVVDPAIGFDEIVTQGVHVVVVDIDGRGASVGILFWCAVGGNGDGIVEIGDAVVGDHVAGTVDFDGVIALEQVRAVGSGAGPERTGPADESEAVIAAQEQIIGNLKLA